MWGQTFSSAVRDSLTSMNYYCSRGGILLLWLLMLQCGGTEPLLRHLPAHGWAGGLEIHGPWVPFQPGPFCDLQQVGLPPSRHSSSISPGAAVFPTDHEDLWASIVELGRWQRVNGVWFSFRGMPQGWPSTVPWILFHHASTLLLPQSAWVPPLPYFRRCQAISLWLFYCPKCFSFYCVLQMQ